MYLFLRSLALGIALLLSVPADIRSGLCQTPVSFLTITASGHALPLGRILPRPPLTSLTPADQSAGSEEGVGPGYSQMPSDPEQQTEEDPGSEQDEPAGPADVISLPIEDSWFDDALFIGDSRMEDLKNYARLGGADYFCTVGMSVFNCYKQKTSDVGYAKQSLESLLTTKKYGKVFVALGINEVGYPHESHQKAYARLVGMIRQTQPDALIFLEGIIPVSRRYAAKGDGLSPSNIRIFNERIASFANGTDIFYLDSSSTFADEEGYLRDGLASDGCHFYLKYCRTWNDWRKAAITALAQQPPEQEAEDQTTQEQEAPEQEVQEQTAQEQSSKEQTPQEQTAQEQTAQKQSSQDQPPQPQNNET